MGGKDSKDGENIEEIKDDLIGTWKSYKMAFYEDGNIVTSNEDKSMFFNFGGNGDGLGRMKSSSELQPLTWKREDDKLFIALSDGLLIMNIFSITTEKLTLEISSEAYSVRYYFEKKSYILIDDNNIITQGAVDLGLSVKWAASNLGASSPEKSGDYYAWGELEPYYSSLKPSVVWKPGKSQGYCDESYKWERTFDEGTFVEEYAKYNTNDGKTVLDPEDDAAHVILGGNWRMPTENEFEELEDNCKLSKAIYNGVLGLVFTSKKNNKSIFFPYNGRFFRTELYQYGEECCLYFSTSSQGHPGNAADNISISEPYAKRETSIGAGRAEGYAIRPVLQE